MIIVMKQTIEYALRIGREDFINAIKEYEITEKQNYLILK